MCKSCKAHGFRFRAATKQCSICSSWKAEACFTKTNWEKKGTKGTCNECLEKRICSNCKKLLNRQCFFRLQGSHLDSQRRCFEFDRQRFSQCNSLKFKNAFTLAAWDLPEGHDEKICTTCSAGPKRKGFWTCWNARCKLQKPLSDFSIVREKYGHNTAGNSRNFNICVRSCEADRAEMAARSCNEVVKKPRHS